MLELTTFGLVEESEPFGKGALRLRSSVITYVAVCVVVPGLKIAFVSCLKRGNCHDNTTVPPALLEPIVLVAVYVTVVLVPHARFANEARLEVRLMLVTISGLGNVQLPATFVGDDVT